MRFLGVGKKWSNSGNILKVEPMGFAVAFSIICDRKKRQKYNVFGLSNAMDGVIFTKMWMTVEEWVCGKGRSLVLTF